MIGRSAPAIVVQADRFDLHRCRCPTRLILDAQFLGTFQLALFPYELDGRRARRPRVDQHIVRRR